MTPVQRLGGLAGLMLALALPAGCHRRLPRPGKPIIMQPAHPAPAPQSGSSGATPGTVGL